MMDEKRDGKWLGTLSLYLLGVEGGQIGNYDMVVKDG